MLELFWSARANRAEQTGNPGDLEYQRYCREQSIFAIAATLSAANALYAIVESRRRELATLRAIRFDAAHLISSLLLNPVLLALPGGFLGRGSSMDPAPLWNKDYYNLAKASDSLSVFYAGAKVDDTYEQSNEQRLRELYEKKESLDYDRETASWRFFLDPHERSLAACMNRHGA